MKPDFWKTRIDEINSILSFVKKGQVSILTKTASGHDIPIVTYGKKEIFKRTANYNSACGAIKPEVYADKVGHDTVTLLVGGIHATEFEGIASLLNLIQLIETGSDFMGNNYDFINNITGRLIIIPLMNIDGRLRQPIDTMLEVNNNEKNIYNQAQWDNGEICSWPDCKSFHPLPISRIKHLGGYYNDKGVNFMHDNFFTEMQPETKALLKLVDDEAPDFTILFHSGGDMPSTPVQPSYVPMYINEKIMELSIKAKIKADKFGIRAGIDSMLDTRFSYPTHSFNLASAIHHTCGGVSAIYESESVVTADMYEKILHMHYILFEETFKLDRIAF